MTKATKNKLLIGGIIAGGILLLRKASQVAPGPAGPALTGLSGGGRGHGGHRHRHHRGGGRGRGPVFWGGPSYWGPVESVDRCIDRSTGLLLPPEYCYPRGF